MHSQETKRKISKALMKNKNGSKTQFQKGHIPWNKGIPRDEETKKKIGEANAKLRKGEKASEATKKKMSEVHKKRWAKIPRNKITERKHQCKIYQEWRAKVYIRDNFTCQLCEDIGKDLNAHHIKSWEKYPKLRYKIDNGITLCRQCHQLVHQIIRLLN